MHMYTELAPWFHLLSSPEDYEEEAAFVVAVVEGTIRGEARALLELGSGGGNNASYLKRRFACTLTDRSPEMLELSRSLNPECEHVLGDMRSLRLDRSFDVVFAHDALSYLTTEDDIRATLRTATAHLRRGGVAVLMPDATTEMFAPRSEHGGHDGADGRSLRYLEWVHAPKPGAATYEVDYAIVTRHPGQAARVVHDRHVLGLFPEHTWIDALREADLEPVDLPVANPFAAEQAAFAARLP
jgi:SAM-dependent methyltransferase